MSGRFDDLGDHGDEHPTMLDQLRARVVRGLALSDMPRPKWLVEGVLSTPSLTTSYGPPKVGKSFAAIDLAASVATGRPWMGRPTTKGTVLYIVGEGASGVIARQEAWSMYHGEADLDGIYWHAGAVNLFSPDHVSALSAFAGEIAADLVVIDTLARCSLGAGENDTKDMGIIVAGLDQIRDACGGCVHVIHHSGKDKAKGLRGSSAFLGAVDVAIEVSGSNGRVRLEVADAKDFADGYSVSYGMEVVGDSIVLVEGAGGDMRATSAKAAEALSALTECATAEGMAATAWRDVADMPDTTFYRARKYLVDRGMVRNVGTAKMPRYVAGGVSS